jgi:hypothetical protein
MKAKGGKGGRTGQKIVVMTARIDSVVESNAFGHLRPEQRPCIVSGITPTAAINPNVIACLHAFVRA